jgi:hypothetical protein
VPRIFPVEYALSASDRPLQWWPATPQDAQDAALEERADIARALGLGVAVVEWTADYSVDADWVTGHLGSAMDADQLALVRATLKDALAAHGNRMVEHVTTTTLVARRP